MFKAGQKVGIQNARLYNGSGVVLEYVSFDVNARPKHIPKHWKAETGEVIVVRCADGVKRRYSNGDTVKIVALEGKSRSELKQFGIGTTLYVQGGGQLKGIGETEIWTESDGTISITPPGRLELVYPYTERRTVTDPSDDDGEDD
jgi:hypothetical protein